KGEEFYNVVKMGRTQLQDAVPMRLGEEFYAYAQPLKRDIKRLEMVREDLCCINMGATAIGNSINATKDYVKGIANEVANITGYPIKQSENLFDGTSNLDTFLSLSSTLKILATNLSKMANDLRLLSSGPKTGIGEIVLPAKQNGSSIMPGKINPVIPEVVSQVCFMVVGSDVTINMAVEAGQLELNAFEPVIFYRLFESLQSLNNVIRTFIDNCIIDLKANPERCENLVNSSAGVATALCPYLGYKKSAEIAKESLKTGLTVKEIVKKYNLIESEKLDEILDIKEMTELK
ncbi:MAG: aspartate ammonia-lyase, partial [Clostridia bacterium]|nr:aspartate ammonia-lyase [Clostridia bacterium]